MILSSFTQAGIPDLRCTHQSSQHATHRSLSFSWTSPAPHPSIHPQHLRVCTRTHSRTRTPALPACKRQGRPPPALHTGPTPTPSIVCRRGSPCSHGAAPPPASSHAHGTTSPPAHGGAPALPTRLHSSPLGPPPPRLCRSHPPPSSRRTHAPPPPGYR